MSSIDEFEEESLTLRQAVASLEDQKRAESILVASRERDFVLQLEGASEELAKVGGCYTQEGSSLCQTVPVFLQFSATASHSLSVRCPFSYPCF